MEVVAQTLSIIINLTIYIKCIFLNPTSNFQHLNKEVIMKNKKIIIIATIIILILITLISIFAYKFSKNRKYYN